MDDIYDMKLGEWINIDAEMNVLRVPGGWIFLFSSHDGAGGFNHASQFVPYSEDGKADLSVDKITRTVNMPKGFETD